MGNEKRNEKLAEILIVGAAVVVRSTIKLDDWRKALAYDPDLGLYDEEEKPLFTVGIEKGPGSMDSHRIAFSSVPDQNGFACVTMIPDAERADKEKMASELYGLALLRLLEIEKNIGDVIAKAEETDRFIAERIRIL